MGICLLACLFFLSYLGFQNDKQSGWMEGGSFHFILFEILREKRGEEGGMVW